MTETETREKIQKLADDIAMVLLAEWIAIEHGETRLEANKYSDEAQELFDWLYVIGFRNIGKDSDQILKLCEPLIRQEVAKEIINKFRKYSIIKYHSKAYGNTYRIEIPVEDYEELFESKVKEREE